MRRQQIAQMSPIAHQRVLYDATRRRNHHRIRHQTHRTQVLDQFARNQQVNRIRQRAAKHQRRAQRHIAARKFHFMDKYKYNAQVRQAHRPPLFGINVFVQKYP